VRPTRFVLHWSLKPSQIPSHLRHYSSVHHPPRGKRSRVHSPKPGPDTLGGQDTAPRPPRRKTSLATGVKHTQRCGSPREEDRREYIEQLKHEAGEEVVQKYLNELKRTQTKLR